MAKLLFPTEFVSASIAKNEPLPNSGTVGTFINATVIIRTNYIINPQNLRFFLSADGGSNWEEAYLNETHTFTNTGTDLKLKIVGVNAEIKVDDDDGNSSPIQVRYEIA